MVTSEAVSISYPEGVLSLDGVTLCEASKRVNALYKRGQHRSRRECRVDVCRDMGLADPVVAALALAVPAGANLVHRVVVGTRILSLRRYGSELHLDVDAVSSSWQRGAAEDKGQVEYGDVALLAKAPQGCTDVNGFQLPAGWWLCKYDLGQPRADVTTISDDQARRIANIFGLQVRLRTIHPVQDVLDEIAHNVNGDPWGPLKQAPAFLSLARWSTAHPRIARAGDSDYFPSWGLQALALQQRSGAP